MKQFTKIEIEWVDSCSSSGWNHLKDYDFEDHEKDMYHRSIGYFLKKTKVALFYCHSRQDTGHNGHTVFAIPMCAVKSIKKVNT